MQQQVTQQEQYGHGNQQQIPQPMMLCPIQYVYETPMLLHQDEQNQPVLINVQNPPPWIQNRPQNHVVYVQHMPNNIQHFIHPNMVQNPMYHQQINYQIPQQVLAHQDIRPVVQIPNLPPYNTVQNQAAPSGNEDATEKMPVLTQMLNQKAMNNPGQPAVNMRPVMQNQQVQTDISAPSRGRPRNGPRPQVITINPMQQRPYVPQKQDVIINIARPMQPAIRNEIPSHIRNKIPSSISVKTIYRPILPRPLMRPYEVLPTAQNFYYNPNFVNIPDNATVRNNVTNTDIIYMQQNRYIQPDRNPKPEVPPFKIAAPTNVQENTVQKPIEKNNEKEKYVQVNTNVNNNAKKANSSEIETQTEEKLMRNTVYVQARGRVLNEKEIVPNPSLKRTIDDRLKDDNVTYGTNTQSPNESSNKHAKIEVIENISFKSNLTDSSTPSAIANVNTQQPKYDNPLENVDNTKTITILPESNTIKSGNENINSAETKDPEIDNLKTKVVNPVENIENLRERNNSDVVNKDTIAIKETKVKNKEVFNDERTKENSNMVKERNSLKNSNAKKDSAVVLTHVLDGYIIQESNVAFPIQKPSKENVEGSTEENIKAKTCYKMADAKDAKNIDIIPHLPLRYQHLNKNIESEEELEFAVNNLNKDDPFANVQKSTVRCWTTDQLAAHLAKHDWKETASKLQDEEIDGESLFLVNKGQLVVIGVCEKHADLISGFISRE